MKYLVILLFLLTVGCRTNEETSQQTLIDLDSLGDGLAELDYGETGCVYSKTDRSPGSTFPFNMADEIELVSYKHRGDTLSNNEIIQNAKFLIPNIQQRIKLAREQKDSLFSILFNYAIIRKGNAVSVPDCYSPQHSIIFYRKGQAIAFLEICFTCFQTRQTEGIDFGEFCDDKWCLLQKFFALNKADYGLDEELCSKARAGDTTQGDTVDPDGISAGDDLDYSGCIRGHAESVTKKAIYPTAIFKLNSDNHTGVETVDLENGDRLIIKNWGCEYYVLTFRIETDRFQADTTNMIYWLDKAVTLMKEVEGGIDAPLNISRGIEAISVHMASMDSRAYELGKEIVFNDDVIRDFVSLDRVQKINERRFAVEISFATGPL